MATHSSVLAWRIPGTEEPLGLPSMGSHRVGHDWSDLAAVATSANTCGKGWWARKRILSLAVSGRSGGTWGSSIFVASWRIVFFFLGVAFGIFNCGTWDLVLWPGMEPGPPALGVLSLSHWTTRKDPGKGRILQPRMEYSLYFQFLTWWGRRRYGV